MSNRRATYSTLIAGIFLYGSAVFINYLVKTVPSLHFGKDGGLVSVALFHCIASYLFFIILKRNALTLLGLGFFVGLATCVFDLFALNSIPWNPSDYFNYLLLHQIISDTIILLVGICYILILKRLQ